jgi:ABC-2 type transport system ATP-binding protein
VRKIIVDEIMAKLANGLAINTSMEDGKKIMDAVREEMGAVTCFQIDDGLYEQLTVNTYLKMFAKLSTTSTENLAEIEKKYGVSEIRKKKIKYLNNTQKRLVSLARMDLQAKEICLLSEPFQGIDKAGFQACLTGVENLAHKARIIVFSAYLDELHNLNIPVYSYDSETQKLELVTKDEPKLSIKIDGKIVWLAPDEIEYIESIAGKVRIVGKEIYESNLTLRELEDKLPYFYRCHRSYLVNIARIKELVTYGKNSYGVVLEDRTEIPVSRTKVKELKELLKSTV